MIVKIKNIKKEIKVKGSALNEVISIANNFIDIVICNGEHINTINISLLIHYNL